MRSRPYSLASARFLAKGRTEDHNLMTEQRLGALPLVAPADGMLVRIERRLAPLARLLRRASR